MYYSGVNVAGLKSAITNLMNNINYESLINASEALGGEAYWNSSLAKTTFMEGLSKNLEFLNNFKISLSDALAICDEIAKWQDLNPKIIMEENNVASYKRMRDQYIGKNDEDSMYYYRYYNNLCITSSHNLINYKNKQRSIESTLNTLLPFNAFGFK